MRLYRSDKVRFIFGLIFIVLIYSSFYLLFFENANLNLPRTIDHGIKFMTTIAVYFVGTYHLGKLVDSWMNFIWHIVHVSGLLVITSLGAYDLLISDISSNLRVFALSVQEILISPMLYLAMGLLNNTLKRTVD
jgi:vacuolar-type H+-ATPase subunit I/STV1